MSHTLEYVAALGAVKFAQALSPAMADRFGASLGRLSHSELASRRRQAIKNLRLSLGEELSESEIADIVRRVFSEFGRTMIEFARFKNTGPEGVNRIVAGAGLDAVIQAHAAGTGGIVLRAHFGNWEMLGAWFACQGIPLDILVARQSNARVNGLINSFRKEMGVGIIQVGATTRNIFKTLRANRFAGIALDQHAASAAIRMDFFGRPAAWAKGPALFALRCGCPLFPLIMRRVSYDKHVMIAGDPIYPPKSGNEDSNIRKMTEVYARFLEENIRKYPDQWLWTHRRWKLEQKIGNQLEIQA